MGKLISIIVAVYNIKEYLPRCIDSILKQTYKDIEILLVDDGSTDGSEAICDHVALQDSRIRVIHKVNGGLSDARNAGLFAARGEFIGFVDGDDWIEPDMYGAMIKACLEESAEVAVCRYRKMRGGEREENSVDEKAMGEIVSLTREEALEIYVCGHHQYIIYNSVWSKLFSAEVVRGLTFVVGKTSEDIMYTTKAFCKMTRCVYLDTPYYNYVLDRVGSIMNERIGERRFENEIPFWKEQSAYFKAQGMGLIAQKSEYYFYRRLLFYYIEFREMGRKEYGKRLYNLLKKDKNHIKVIYANDFVALGDRVRMKMMLAIPGLYYQIVKLYEKYVIPLRQGDS